MKRTFFVISVALMAIAIHAQLLWKVTGPALQKPSYLFGTMHFEHGDFIDSVAGLNDVIHSVETCYLEIESSQMSSPETMTMLAQRSLAPQDSTLDQLLSPEDLKIVESVINKHFANMVNIETFKPLKPAATLQAIVAMQAMKGLKNFDMGEEKIDAAVESQARRCGHAISSLETVEFQADLLLGAPLTQQAAELLEFCKADGEVEVKLKALIEAYEKQDLDKILEYLYDPAMGGGGNDLERLLFNRNRNWVKTLVPAMERQSVLVSVGAGHLPTEQGLIQLLRNQGLTVEAVKAKEKGNQTLNTKDDE